MFVCAAQQNKTEVAKELEHTEEKTVDSLRNVDTNPEIKIDIYPKIDTFNLEGSLAISNDSGVSENLKKKNPFIGVWKGSGPQIIISDGGKDGYYTFSGEIYCRYGGI